MQEHNFDLRPPLPPRDYPYPLRGRSHASYGGDKVSEGGKGQGLASCPFQEDEDNFASLPPKAKLILRSMLCRMYASAEVMQLGSETRFTALVLFHRYYLASNVIGALSQSHEVAAATGRNDCSSTAVSEKWREHLGTVAASCLFLGCKVEEEHRRIRDVINLSHMFDFAGTRGDPGIGKFTKANGEPMNDDQQQPAATRISNDDIMHIHEANSPPDLDDDYWKAKEQIVATEQEVLRMLHFDVSVSHPHRAVLLILKGLGIDVTTDEGRTLANKSFTALNDALFYPPSLRHGVLPLACASIRLAVGNGERNDKSISGVGAPAVADDSSSSSSFSPPGAWWRRFDVSDADIEIALRSLERARALLKSI